MSIDNNTLNFLNLKEDQVEDISTTSNNNNIFFNVILKRTNQKCPSCNLLTNKIKDYKIKIIKHSIFNDGRESFISYKQRRYFCSICNKSFIEPNPFVNNNDKVSKLLIFNILFALTNANETYDSVAKRFNISPTTVRGIFDKNIIYQRSSLPEIICIDEFHCSSNTLTKYACVFLDFKNNKIIDILKSRRKDYLQNYLTKISIENRKKVKHVSIDMWETYRQMAYLYFPNAIVSIDSFHVIQDIERYVDKIRISIMNKYDKRSDQYYLLKNFGWLTKIKFSNIPNKEAKFNHRFNKYLTYSDIFNMIMEISVDLKDAYDWKEDYIRFNKNSTIKNAPENFNDLICKLQKLNISFMNPIVSTLIKWKKEILNSFIRYDGVRISNGPIEGRNSTIKTIKKVSNGITNFTRFRNRIMFVINKDFYFDTNKKEIKKMR